MTMTDKQRRVAIVFPADANAGLSTRVERTRFSGIAGALASTGIEAVGAPYADQFVEEVRAQLLSVEGVLVWINPIQEGQGRSILNAMLTDVASKGVFVSAHPDVIDKMGTKEVLYLTREMSCSCDTRLYATSEAMRAELPASLGFGARVLKQIRAQSGDGVWKVELADAFAPPPSTMSPDTALCVRHAMRGSAEERMSLGAFLARCEPYFAHRSGVSVAPHRGNGTLLPRAGPGRGVRRTTHQRALPSRLRTPPSDAPQPGPRH